MDERFNIVGDPFSSENGIHTYENPTKNDFRDEENTMKVDKQHVIHQINEKIYSLKNFYESGLCPNYVKDAIQFYIKELTDRKEMFINTNITESK